MKNGIIEQMQAEITDLKAKVAILASASRIADILERHKVDGEYLPVKSPQDIRDEIIEKAKRDIAELKCPGELFGKTWDYREKLDGYSTLSRGSGNAYNCEYVVNRKRNTVVALLRGYNTSEVMSRGIAKCDPSDCFSVHIGKAIALRRALGLEVPAEYLSAPQPTEVRVGDIAETTNEDGKVLRFVVGRIENGRAYTAKDSRVYARLDGGDYHGGLCTNPKTIDDSREEVAE